MKSFHRPLALALLLGLASASACKKSPDEPAPSAPPAPVQLRMPSDKATAQKRTDEFERALDKRYPGKPAEKEAMRKNITALDAQLDAEDRLADIHRKTMVTPAPTDFKPEPVARKVRLKLVLEQSHIRVGDAPRFRLEMANVGRETIDYHEARSSLFVKGGSLLDSLTMSIYVTDGRGRRKRLTGPSPETFQLRRSRLYPRPRITPPTGLSDAAMGKWFMETNAMGQAHASFKIKLLPGETLHSIGDPDSPVENFKTLFTDDDFDVPGEYRLQLELDDRPEPLTERDIQHKLTFETEQQARDIHAERVLKSLGPVASNAVLFEIVR